MRTITHAIDTRPFFRPSVQLEKNGLGTRLEPFKPCILAWIFIILLLFPAVISALLRMWTASVTRSVCCCPKSSFSHFWLFTTPTELLLRKLFCKVTLLSCAVFTTEQPFLWLFTIPTELMLHTCKLFFRVQGLYQVILCSIYNWSLFAFVCWHYTIICP